jgi:hypothetical protein
MATTDKIKRPIRIRSILAAASAAIGLGGAAHAQSGPVELSIVDRDTGQVLQTWRHHGHLYVVGQPGARYSLRVANRTDGRVLVVMSVDGVNILTGETADYGQRGYVFSPHEAYDVTGWRKSSTEVAAFAFAPLPQSYAARTGRPNDVGVIGMAVFREKVVAAPPPEASSNWRNAPDGRSRGYSDKARSVPVEAPPPSDSVSEIVVTGGRAAHAPAPTAGASAPPASTARAYAAAPAAAPPPRDEKLGTAHGAREWSMITLVTFERATAYPQYIRQIEYDTYANLVASGVIEPADAGRHPQPFPSHPDTAGYVPDPPNDP